MNTYLFVTKEEFEPHRVKQSSKQTWSCSKTTEKGDRILVYVAKKGIVEQWEATSQAEEDKSWKYICGVVHKRTILEPLTMAQIIRLFSKSEWPAAHQYFRGYQSIMVSEKIVAKLMRHCKTVKPLRTAQGSDFPDELVARAKYVEGTRRSVLVNAHERNASARKACLRRHGVGCIVCQVRLQERYGVVGKVFIHVHHLKPLARARGKYDLNPETDLVPVCPNCHAMLHRPKKMLSPQQLRDKLKRAGN